MTESTPSARMRARTIRHRGRRAWPLLAAALFWIAAGGSALAQEEEAEEERTIYEVEIVLFENRDVRDAEDERWSPQVVVPEFREVAAFERGALRSAELADLPEGFRALGTDAARLAGAVKRLRDTDRYRVLRHVIWQQPGLDRGEAVAIRLHEGEPISLRIPEPAYAAPTLGPPPPREGEAGADGDATAGEDGGEDESGATGPGDTAGEDGADAGTDDPSLTAGGPEDEPAAGSLDESGVQAESRSGMRAPRERRASVYPLDGTVTLVVSRYLHVHADFYYTTAVDWGVETAGSGYGADGEPGDAGANGDGAEEMVAQRSPTAGVAGVRAARTDDGRAMLSYPFVQRRRMRSGELHYLDSPVLGMLILVTPREGEAGQGGNGSA